MKDLKFIFIVLLVAFSIGGVSNVKADDRLDNPSSDGVYDYSHYFASSGGFSPEQTVLSIIPSEDDFYSYASPMVLINTSGIDGGSDGNTSNTKHDVYVYGRLINSSGEVTSYNFFENINGNGVGLCFHMDGDNIAYEIESYGIYTSSGDGLCLRYKKCWNDTWSGTLTGTFDVF